MTGTDQANSSSHDTPRPQRPEDIVEALRLRPDGSRVTRLSRKVIAGGTAMVLAIVCGAGLWSLQDRSKRGLASKELYSTDHRSVADELASLPKDYAGIPRDAPRLGPPLPGDLGRPIVAAQSLSETGPLAIDAAQQRITQEAEAARTSKLFANTTVRQSPGKTIPDGMPSAATSSDEAFAQNGQDRKLAFVNAPVDRRTTSPDRLVKPASPFSIQAGTIIPAALITGIRSDLPGQVTAQVTENIFDSPTGRVRIVPQGARLIGSFDSQIAFGQSRVLLVWTRLILPNGRSVVLERQPAADAAGYSGLENEVDNHWKALIGAAALSTLLAVGAEVNSGADVNDTNSALVQALRRGTGSSFNQTGQQVMRRNLNIQPTLTIRPGFPVRVIVNRDLVLEPYRG